jgi:epoxyqueuosine reductase
MNSNLDAGEPGSLPPLVNQNVVRELAVNRGFSEAAVIALPHANEGRDSERFTTWIDANRAGTMQYLKRTNEAGELVRARAATPFPWAQSAIVCLASYNSDQPRSTDPAPEDAAWIARYAWSSRVDAQRGRVPSDYHKVLLKRLKALEQQLHEHYGGFESRAYVDTGPVVERSLAVAAGLGWSAKNVCLIHPRLGSYVFLSVLITSLHVEREAVPLTVPDRCGSCTRCIEACPTDALFAPYQMDATRCISYLTIEHKGVIAPELMKGMGRQVFGCDICQEVCPWNKKASQQSPASSETRPELINPALTWLANLGPVEFNRQFRGSPIKRTKHNGLLRNVAVAMGNSGEREFLPQLEIWTNDADTVLADAATWALERLDSRKRS